MYNEINVSIPTPSDSSDRHHVVLSSDVAIFDRANHSIGLKRTSKDPIHDGLNQFFQDVFRKKRPRRYHRTVSQIQYPVLLTIGSCPVYIEKATNRFSINGQSITLDVMTNALARLAFKAAFEENATKLLPFFYSILSLPEDVRYVIENRVPYHFFDAYTKHEVRLNVTQISDTECAIEMGDGIWGNITIKELTKFCKFYVKNRKSSWAFTSPENLYIKLLGKKPSVSELKVMVAFLKQNRKQDIVERRAEKLVSELLEQYPKHLRGLKSPDGKVQSIIVRGKDYDWKLAANGSSTGTQMVSTWVWQPQHSLEEGEKDKGTRECHWKGSICIDNLTQGSSLGDQFATRALAFINDRVTMKMVGTIRSYITAEPNKYRNGDFNEMR